MMINAACGTGGSGEAGGGVDDADAGAGAAAGGDASGVASDAAPSLGCPAGCLPPAPAGWTGPSAVYDGPSGTKPAACPAQYEVAVLEAHQGLAAAPAVCSCGTPKFEDQTCKTVAEYWNAPECTGFAVKREGEYPYSKCIGPAAGVQSMRVLPAVYSGTCSFDTPSKTLPPPVFEKTQVACGLAAPAACAGRPECTTTPAPDAPFTRVCIHKDGDHACPSLDYAVRFVSHRGTSDTRDCTPCGKATAKGTCGTGLSTWDGLDCTGVKVAIVANTCYPQTIYVDLNGTAPVDPTCEPEPGGNQPTGELAPKDPVTFCCNQ